MENLKMVELTGANRWDPLNSLRIGLQTLLEILFVLHYTERLCGLAKLLNKGQGRNKKSGVSLPFLDQFQ